MGFGGSAFWAERIACAKVWRQARACCVPGAQRARRRARPEVREEAKKGQAARGVGSIININVTFRVTYCFCQRIFFPRCVEMHLAWNIVQV